MLRINLLPAYIAEQRRVRAAIVLAIIVFAVATALPLGYYFQQVKPTQDKASADDITEQGLAKDEQDQESKTAAKRALIVPIADKFAFVQHVLFHNTVRQKIFRNAAKYTYRSVEYNSMSVTGNTLSLSATVSSLDDIGRFYLTMFANPDVSAVSIAGVPDYNTVQNSKPVLVPGGPPPMPPQYNIAMNAVLTHSVATPTLPATLLAAPGGAGGAVAPGGGVGMPPGGQMGAPPSGGPGGQMGPPPSGPPPPEMGGPSTRN